MNVLECAEKRFFLPQDELPSASERDDMECGDACLMWFPNAMRNSREPVWLSTSWARMPNLECGQDTLHRVFNVTRNKG